ncbi:MarR family winged helix-turn-helix transcriptional regulator [Actinoplanes sp. M2I2]|uniref:MarR family winged helix-turn-helix transcriptional regulator n=1 Tax=Actinoplanes sp. M2I2 TaxID=1734444 RepID=UPI002021864C|nr:MarR family transcriptional regulator [Actinoplanes sp. M2I2]
MPETKDTPQPPARLRTLASWQASKMSTIGTRLFARRMKLSARADFAVLAVLEESGPLSQADIGRRLGLDRNDVNGILNRLESEHRVRRETDPADRRRNVVLLTGEGRLYLDELQEYTEAVQDELLAGLSAAERRHLRELLTKLLGGHRQEPA